MVLYYNMKNILSEIWDTFCQATAGVAILAYLYWLFSGQI